MAATEYLGTYHKIRRNLCEDRSSLDRHLLQKSTSKEKNVQHSSQQTSAKSRCLRDNLTTLQRTSSNPERGKS